MANLIRRDGNEPARTQQREVDPMRMMREMLRWDPFREMQSFFGRESEVFDPDFEIADHKDRFVFRADLPGVKESDLEVKLTGNRLTISGKRESEHEDKADSYYACERSYGSFTRSFTLPTDQADLDHATADLRDGVLTIAIPKLAQAQSRSISVKGTGTQKS
ncbi:MAG TPA: Hsp20/alpha crystallin family protein [Kofleriaceae bacterium]|nr:Hsp20/alpha crystallin family protein [Kofleriaceae bacterium]